MVTHRELVTATLKNKSVVSFLQANRYIEHELRCEICNGHNMTVEKSEGLMRWGSSKCCKKNSFRE